MTVTIKDLSRNEELDRAAMAAAQAAGRNFHFNTSPRTSSLTTPDGEPVHVYVDGVPVNSVTTGYVPK